MDKPISVGDLVMVVRSTCTCAGATCIGMIFQVTEIGFCAAGSHCRYCKKSLRKSNYHYAKTDVGHLFGLDRLKRIPPLDELESEKRDEEIEA